MERPTDDELEAMAVRWDEARKLYEDAGVFGKNGADLCRASAAMLRACKGRVRVKPLVWEQARDGAGWHPQLTIAYCPVFDKRFYAEHPEKQARIDTAREARILSALEPAERDALKAELADAVEVLRKSTIAIDELISDDLGTLDYNSIRNLVHKNRAFLARHQKETDT